MIFTAHSVSAEGEYDYACGRQALQTERNPYQPEYLPSIGSIDFCRVTDISADVAKDIALKSCVLVPGPPLVSANGKPNDASPSISLNRIATVRTGHARGNPT